MQEIDGVFYIESQCREGVIDEEQLSLVLLGARQAYLYPVEFTSVRHQLNEAKNARGFFNTELSPTGDRGKGKSVGKGMSKGATKGKGKYEGQSTRSRTSFDQVKLRTQCACCKADGHRARECPQGRSPDRRSPPALTGLSTPGVTFYAIDDARDTSPSFFIGLAMASGVTGISLNADEALLGAGAQEAIVGKKYLARKMAKFDSEGLPHE